MKEDKNITIEDVHALMAELGLSINVTQLNIDPHLTPEALFEQIARLLKQSDPLQDSAPTLVIFPWSTQSEHKVLHFSR